MQQRGGQSGKERSQGGERNEGKKGGRKKERVSVSKWGVGGISEEKKSRWRAARATNEVRGPNVPPPISSCRPPSLSDRKPFKVKLA